MKDFLSGFQKVAVEGARKCPGATFAVSEVLNLLSPEVEIFTGCAQGVDRAAREAFPHCSVLKASDYQKEGVPARASFAIRAAAVVRSVAPGGLLIVCPAKDQQCPEKVQPRRTWSGGGSGSWAAAALGVGLGCVVLLWIAPGVKRPKWSLPVIQEERQSAAGIWLILNPAKNKLL